MRVVHQGGWVAMRMDGLCEVDCLKSVWNVSTANIPFRRGCGCCCCCRCCCRYGCLWQCAHQLFLPSATLAPHTCKPARASFAQPKRAQSQRERCRQQRERDWERELARLNFKCVAWKIDIDIGEAIAMSATAWREYMYFVAVVGCCCYSRYLFCCFCFCICFWLFALPICCCCL